MAPMELKDWTVRGVSSDVVDGIKRLARKRRMTLGGILNAALRTYLSASEIKNDGALSGTDAGLETTLTAVRQEVASLRENLEAGHRLSGVIWFIGLCGSGKTTLCNTLRDRLKPRHPQVMVMDGDRLRAALGGNHGYTEADRIAQFRRVQRLVKEFESQGLLVLVGTLYSNSELLAWNHANLHNYFEIHIKAPMELLRQRDPKGLYAKAASGETQNVVGVDIPWHEPEDSHMVIDMGFQAPPEALVSDIAARIPGLSDAGGSPPH